MRSPRFDYFEYSCHSQAESCSDDQMLRNKLMLPVVGETLELILCYVKHRQRQFSFIHASRPAIVYQKFLAGRTLQ